MIDLHGILFNCKLCFFFLVVFLKGRMHILAIWWLFYYSMTYDEHFNMQDAASLTIAIIKKKLRGRTFNGCDNHPLSRSSYKNSFFCPSVKLTIWVQLYQYKYCRVPKFIAVFLTAWYSQFIQYLECHLCRQEIMDSVNRSGKYSKKFLGFTGMFLDF